MHFLLFCALHTVPFIIVCIAYVFRVVCRLALSDFSSVRVGLVLHLCAALTSIAMDAHVSTCDVESCRLRVSLPGRYYYIAQLFFRV